MNRPRKSTGSFSPRLSMSVMRLCAASRPVSSLPVSSSTSPGFQVAASSLVTVSRFTRRAPETSCVSFGQSSRFGGSRYTGPDPSSTMCAWRVAAQLGIIATGRLAAWAGVSSTFSVVYGAVVASGATSQNAVVIDSTNQMIYASFNSNGTNAIVVQAPTSLASTVTVPVGAATTTFTGPYSPDFNNAFYAGSGT